MKNTSSTMKMPEVNNPARNTDLTDPKKDQKKLNKQETTIDMPEVSDIPGQRNIKVPDMKEMQDVTIASDGDEAEELLQDLNKPGKKTAYDPDSEVSEEEKKLLRRGAGHPRTEENSDISNISLDNTDEDGEALNEKGFDEDRFGEDLDVPGAELDDDNEDLGEEDEENNQYSRRD